MVKSFCNRNSRRIISHINAHAGNVPHELVNFHISVLLAKLPNTSTRELLSV